MTYTLMDIDLKEIGNRLFKIRHILDCGGRGGQRKFATKVLGVSDGTYSVWERGDGLIPVIHALAIVRRFSGKISLDYIYLGGFRFLTVELADALREAPDRPEPLKKSAAPKPAGPAKAKRSKAASRKAASRNFKP